MSKSLIPKRNKTLDISVSEAALWCEQIETGVNNLNLLGDAVIQAVILSPLRLSTFYHYCGKSCEYNQDNSNIKNKATTINNYQGELPGLHFKTQWYRTSPRTNFMYEHQREEQLANYPLYYINLDPYFFNRYNSFTKSQSFFFFFYHEFAHCIDVYYSNQSNTLIAHETTLNASTTLFNHSLPKEAFADIIALRLLFNYHHNLNIKPIDIARFRHAEHIIEGDSHNTSQFLKHPQCIEFIETPRILDLLDILKLKALILNLMPSISYVSNY